MTLPLPPLRRLAESYRIQTAYEDDRADTNDGERPV